MIYIICGMPGVGKTTYSKKLVEEKGAVRLSLDEQTEKLFGDQDACDWGTRERATKYNLLMDVKGLVDKNVSVILDYGFFKDHERKWYRELATAFGTESEIHFITTDYDTQLNRVLKRNNEVGNIHDIDKGLLDKLITQFEVPKDSDLIVVDTTEGMM